MRAWHWPLVVSASQVSKAGTFAVVHRELKGNTGAVRDRPEPVRAGPKRILQPAGVRIFGVDGDERERASFDDSDCVDRVGHRLAVGANEAARAQQHSAEVARHDRDRVGQIAFGEHGEHGGAGRSGRLAVVIRPLEAAVRPHAIGGTIVVRVPMSLADDLDRAPRFFLRRCARQRADEPRFFDDELVRAVFGNGPGEIGHYPLEYREPDWPVRRIPARRFAARSPADDTSAADL